MAQDRRTFLRVSAGVAATAAVGAVVYDRKRQADAAAPRWMPSAVRTPAGSRVAVLHRAAYDTAALEDDVARGLDMFALDVAGRRVVLKPNFVEYDPASVINTNPALVGVVAQAFKRMGARSVVVAEGPGHRRDNAYLLAESGLLDMLRDTRTPYVDLNMDDVVRVACRSHYTSLGELWLPRTIVEADLVVSMPKLKTHHWAGVTLSMKNLFGIMPGSVYGWPKNVLHQQGIENSILDISAALERPPFTIVDGIVGMEGNGPIQGTAVQSGVLIFGDDPVAVDASAARIMGVDPERVGYIAEAGRFLGNIGAARITQIGEPATGRTPPFELLHQHAGLRYAGS
ncbi:MAG: DUF362 domain-containing protein [Gemmatimonadota bacterium]